MKTPAIRCRRRARGLFRSRSSIGGSRSQSWFLRLCCGSCSLPAALPIGVSHGGGLNSGPYLGFVIGLSVIAFYFGERDDRLGLYYVAGMFAGWVYWIKQVVVLFGLVFIFLAVTNWRLRWNWIWF